MYSDALHAQVKRCSRAAAGALVMFSFGCAQDLTTATAASAYAPGIAQPVLETSKTEYTPGDVITVRLINQTSRQLLYNLCRSKLERIVDGNWETANETLVQGCPEGLRVLSPRRAVAFSFRLNERARRPLRIRTELEDYHSRAPVQAVSNEFTVRSGD